jgi:hypothetical protein
VLDRYLAVFKSFQEHGVKYVVIGGMAVIAHGVPRSTFDLDILIEATPGNAHRLLEALRSCGFVTADLTTPDRLLRHDITIFEDRLPIDVQIRTPGLRFETAWKNRERVDFRGQVVNVACRRDMIRSKRASGRAIDREDVKALLARPATE